MALSISRRSFMKCLGLTAAASASGALMTGCAQGPVTGNFGIPASLIEGQNAVDITLTGLEWSPFDISLSEINFVLQEHDINIDLPDIDIDFSIISSVLGYGCAMPKALIQNETDKTLIVLPYFPNQTLQKVFNDFVKPKVEEYKDDLGDLLGEYLSKDETIQMLSAEIDKLLIDQIGESWNDIKSTSDSILKDAYDGTYWWGVQISGGNGISDVISKLNLIFQLIKLIKLENTLVGLIYDLIISTFGDLSDSFRILMVQGRFDGQLAETELDQALNVAAAGYALAKNKPTPMLLDPIEAGASVAGFLPIPAKRSWRTLQLIFSLKNILLSFKDSSWLTWGDTGTSGTASHLLMYLLLFMIYKDTQREDALVDLNGTIMKELTTGLVGMATKAISELAISLDDTGSDLGVYDELNFQNMSAIF